MLRAAKGHRFYLLRPVSAATDMRLGAGLELRWSALDESRATITISRSRSGSGSRKHFETLRTASDAGTVAVDRQLLGMLRYHRQHQRLDRLAV